MEQKQFRRCVSFCTASAYDLSGLNNFFKRKNHYITHLSRDVLHVIDSKVPADIYFFNHGSVVCWGFSKIEEQRIIKQIADFATDSLSTIQTDHFCYRFGEETSIDSHERFKVDVITLDSDNPQIKLAISYALAQSIKLEAFEDAIQETIRKNGYLPVQMSKKGSISLSRKALFKRMGEIFIVRSSINLNTEFLESPEFFWRNPNLEPFYIMTKKFLDIRVRVATLNQQLDVLQELLDMLNTQIQHRHSSLLETIIILLILMELTISLMQIYVHGL